MKITVSLDSQAVIVQPSPLRIKAGAFVPVAIAFTRASQTVSLPQGAVIEYALKPRNQWTGGLLAYLNSFEVTAGNIYTGTLNCASASLLGALGISDSTPLNDIPQIEASAEVTWSFGGQKYRSSTFPVIIETPLTDDNPIPTPDPELYPNPGAIALKSEIPTLPDLTPYALKSEVPVVGTAAKLDAGVASGAATLDTGGKLVQAQVPDSVALKSEIPVVGTASKLDAGVPNGAATLDAGGKLAQTQVPDAVALKNELPEFATTEEAAAGTRADVVMSPLDVVTWFNAKLPGDAGVALLGNNSWGLPDLSGYSGAIAGDGTSISGVTAIALSSPFGLQFYDSGTGLWVSSATLQAPGINGVYGASFSDDFGTWLFANGIQAPWFSGDGTNLSNLTAFQLISPWGYSIFDSGGGEWQVNGDLNANGFYGNFNGDGSNLSNLTALQLLSPYGNSIYDSGSGDWQVDGNVSANAFNGAFSGDGSNLSNVAAVQVTSPWGYSIYDTGSGNWQIDGGVSAGWFSGEGSSLSNLTAFQLSSQYGYSIYDSGWGNWQVNGNLYANSFSGDGSGLGNINASQLNSPYGYSIYDTGWGNWQVNGGISASWFSGDGSGLSNLNTEYAQYAYCDEYGNEIAYSYVQQSGYYGSLSVGNADWAYNCQNANYASNADSANSTQYAYCANSDNWGYELYGAGNIQWNFFGGSPNPGDVVTFDGNYWSPAPGTPVPTTVATAADRFAAGGLKTGWLVKQLDNRTVYQVLDPNDCATELGWVPVGPFILIPDNSTPLVIDNTSPVLGTTIHCSAGTWSDNPTSYADQWYRNGSPISGATALAYTVVAADDGASLQCVISAINPAGTGTDNVTIPMVVLNAPANTTAPSISPSGTPNVGDTLSLSGGSWTGYGCTTTCQWKRAGIAISGATAATYTLVAADAGHAITCTVTRTNIRGSAAVTTAATGAVTNLIAVNTAIPTLSPATLFPGAVVTCSPGTWNYHPTSYNYQWRRNGAAISGATSQTYLVASGDVGATLSCVVTATNPAGTSGAIASGASSSVVAIKTMLADSSLLAFWKLDETSGTRIDISGNGRNLSPSETITTVPGPFGAPCAAFRRSGYLQNTTLTPTFTGQILTASLWVRLLALEEGNFMTQWSGGGWLNLGSCTTGLRLGFGHDCLDNIVVPVSTGTWHHVTQSWDGNQIRATVDGHEYTLNTANMPENPPRLTNANAPFDIGCSDTWNSSSRANADICCVGLWKRALTAAETTTLYNSGAGLTYPF